MMLAIRMALRLHSGRLANIQPRQRFNPRAAGEDLLASVTVVRVRGATADEERRGRV